MKQATRMLDLEDRLYADRDGMLREKMLADLRRIQSRLQGELRQLNDRNTYRELQGALQAVTGAVQVLRTLRIR
jgi:hypothetical protein